ncbi:hypothetical protein BDR26DRAFT_866814, partial [Obelidium mucronatum]
MASDLPLEEYAFGVTEYRAVIQVGTPPRNYNVLFDTGSFTTWLYGATCTSLVEFFFLSFFFVVGVETQCLHKRRAKQRLIRM